MPKKEEFTAYFKGYVLKNKNGKFGRMDLKTRFVKSWRTFKKEYDLLVSKRINKDSVDSVTIMLGPYRNLTTLTASIAFLHPQCQVLNHGGQRIFNDRRLDFLKDYSNKRFENFLKYAIHISGGGDRGNYGGSITLSHAFQENSQMWDIYQQVDHPLIKENIKCLFWKESQKVTNHIRKNQLQFSKLFFKNTAIKFLLPVRNPLDCAFSNHGSGFLKYLPGVNSASNIEEVLGVILDEYLWFIELERKYPNRFYHYFAHNNSKETLREFEKFLGLDPSPEWLKLSSKVFIIKANYIHRTDLIQYFQESVNDLFSDYPLFQAGLLKFIT